MAHLLIYSYSPAEWSDVSRREDSLRFKYLEGLCKFRLSHLVVFYTAAWKARS